MTLHFKQFEDEGAPQTARIINRTAPRRQLYRSYGKRALDVTLTILSAPFVVPFIVLMAIVIMCDGHNPFYSQRRIGKNGREFRMWKLRTMVHNADEMLEEYLAENTEARAEWDASQKLKKDPRITLVGRILRKTSMDELPQLWNVVNGSMSLIGPRPMMVNQKQYYMGTAYYKLQPGITGLWQVSDRNEGEFVGRVRFDDIYDRTVSFKLDLWILMRTVGVVIRCTGY